MKTIELTEEHRSKLLEMCRKLFPELEKEAYNRALEYYGKNYEVQGFYITGDNHIGCSYPNDNSDDSFHHHLIEQIHWFEFCMTHLFNELFIKPNGYESIEDYISMNHYFILGHPVDYLYKEFKKLK